MRGSYTLIVGIVLVLGSVVAFFTFDDPTPGVALLAFGVVLAGFGWHLRSRETPAE